MLIWTCACAAAGAVCWLRRGALTSYTWLLRAHLKMGKSTLMPAARTIQSVSTTLGRSGGLLGYC